MMIKYTCQKCNKEFERYHDESKNNHFCKPNDLLKDMQSVYRRISEITAQLTGIPDPILSDMRSIYKRVEELQTELEDTQGALAHYTMTFEELQRQKDDLLIACKAIERDIDNVLFLCDKAIAKSESTESERTL